MIQKTSNLPTEGTQGDKLSDVRKNILCLSTVTELTLNYLFRPVTSLTRGNPTLPSFSIPQSNFCSEYPSNRQIPLSMPLCNWHRTTGEHLPVPNFRLQTPAQTPCEAQGGCRGGGKNQLQLSRASKWQAVWTTRCVYSSPYLLASAMGFSEFFPITASNDNHSLEAASCC